MKNIALEDVLFTPFLVSHPNCSETRSKYIYYMDKERGTVMWLLPSCIQEIALHQH